jgi:hypothetical protein
MNEVQEELNQQQRRWVEIAVKSTAMTTGKLAKGMAEWLCRQNGSVGKVGRQTLKQLTKHGDKIEDIPIIDKRRIKDFESIARKHGVSYAVEKDTSSDPPQHRIFFKARDTDAIAAAFKEYTAKHIDRQKSQKTPMEKRLNDAKERVKNQVVDTDKHQRREHDGR